jgi:hypothetical protein
MPGPVGLDGGDSRRGFRSAPLPDRNREEGWVIVDPSAGCLFEVERCMWSSDKPLVFDTPAGALAAFLRARENEEGRKRRYREAMIRLGRPLQGPLRYEEELSLGS